MAYRDLRDFMAQLEATGDLRRVHEPVSPHLEMTALSDRVLRAGGPALLFEEPAGHHMPVLTNLFGTTGRVARAMGVPDLRGVRALGELLATLKEPEAPKGFKDMLGIPGEFDHIEIEPAFFPIIGRGPRGVWAAKLAPVAFFALIFPNFLACFLSRCSRSIS